MSDAHPTRRDFMVHSAGALAAFTLVPDLSVGAPAAQDAPLKLGLVGAGRQGRAIVDELQKLPGVDVAAVYDTTAGRLDAMLGRVKGAEGFSDHRALLDKRPDVTARRQTSRLKAKDRIGRE